MYKTKKFQVAAFYKEIDYKKPVCVQCEDAECAILTTGNGNSRYST